MKRTEWLQETRKLRSDDSCSYSFIDQKIVEDSLVISTNQYFPPQKHRLQPNRFDRFQRFLRLKDHGH